MLVARGICNRAGREVYASPSSISTHRACPRKWWYLKVWGIEDPKGKAATFGTLVHWVLESHLRGALNLAVVNGEDLRALAVGERDVPPDTSDGDFRRAAVLARVGLDFMPLPGTVKPEMWLPRVRVASVGDVEMNLVGKVDMHRWDPATGTLWVGDHKTTGRVERAHTRETLARDPQLLTYVKVLADHYGASELEVSHLYYLTSGSPRGFRVDAPTTLENVQENWNSVVSSVESMILHGQAVDAEDVPCNTSACGDFGGCPARAVCSAFGKRSKNPFSDQSRAGLPPVQHLQHLAGEDDMSAVNELLKKAMAAKAAMEANNGGGVKPPDAPAPTVQVTPSAPSDVPATNAPAEESSESTHAYVGMTEEEAKEAYKEANNIGRLHATRWETFLGLGGLAVVDGKITLARTDTSTETKDPGDTEVSDEVESIPESRPVAFARAPQATLYVNCRPSRRAVLDISEYPGFAEWREKFESSKGVPYFGLYSDYADNGYKRALAFFATSFRASGGPVGSYVMDSFLPYAPELRTLWSQSGGEVVIAAR